MKNSLRKSLSILFAGLILISVLSSCNRNGYGCPYELELPVPSIHCIAK